MQINRYLAPKLQEAAGLSLAEPKRIQLPNGIAVYIFEDHSQQAFRMDIIFAAGTASQRKKLIAGSVIRMLSEGSARYTASAISAKIDYHGAYLDQQTTKDSAWLSLYGLMKSFDRLLPLIESIIKQPVFAEKSFDLYLKRQLQEFKINSNKIKHIASRNFNSRLFGADTPYGQTAEESDYQTINTHDLKAFHGKYYNPAHCSIIICGPVNDKTLQTIVKHFGDNWSSQTANPMNAFELKQGIGTFFVPKEGSLQSAIRMGRLVMPRKHPDYFGFLVLNTLFGGYFGSRLMSNIREDKGYTNGIHSQVTPYRYGSSWVITTEVGAAVTRQTLQEIKHEMRRLQEEIVENEELELVKNYLHGTYLRALDGVFNQSERFRGILDSELGMQYFYNSLQAVQKMDANRLQQLAQQYLKPDEMLTVVVGAEPIEL